MPEKQPEKLSDLIIGAAVIGVIIGALINTSFGIGSFIFFGSAVTINYLRKQDKNQQKVSALSIPKLNYPVSTSSFEWPATGGCYFDIVGESHYQPALEEIAGDHGDKGVHKSCKAFLIQEDDNQHDNKAVRVEINGYTIGYLDRESARSFRRRLGAKHLSGQITSCGAEIKGGWIMENGQRASYGVALDIKDFI
jgi:hypothetical protein